MISKGRLPFKDPGVSFPRLWSYAFLAPIQRHQSRSGGALIFNTRERFATFAVKPLMFQQDGIPVILQGTLLPVLSRKGSLPACVVEHSLQADPTALGGDWRAHTRVNLRHQRPTSPKSLCCYMGAKTSQYPWELNPD